MKYQQILVLNAQRVAVLTVGSAQRNLTDVDVPHASQANTVRLTMWTTSNACIILTVEVFQATQATVIYHQVIVSALQPTQVLSVKS